MHRRSFSTWFGRKEVSSWPQVDKVIISHILRHLPERSWKVSICELCLFNLQIMRKSHLEMFFVIIPQKMPVHIHFLIYDARHATVPHVLRILSELFWHHLIIFERLRLLNLCSNFILKVSFQLRFLNFRVKVYFAYQDLLPHRPFQELTQIYT